MEDELDMGEWQQDFDTLPSKVYPPTYASEDDEAAPAPKPMQKPKPVKSAAAAAAAPPVKAAPKKKPAAAKPMEVDSEVPQKQKRKRDDDETDDSPSSQMLRLEHQMQDLRSQVASLTQQKPKTGRSKKPADAPTERRARAKPEARGKSLPEPYGLHANANLRSLYREEHSKKSSEPIRGLPRRVIPMEALLVSRNASHISGGVRFVPGSHLSSTVYSEMSDKPDGYNPMRNGPHHMTIAGIAQATLALPVRRIADSVTCEQIGDDGIDWVKSCKSRDDIISQLQTVNGECAALLGDFPRAGDMIYYATTIWTSDAVNATSEPTILTPMTLMPTNAAATSRDEKLDGKKASVFYKDNAVTDEQLAAWEPNAFIIDSQVRALQKGEQPDYLSKGPDNAWQVGIAKVFAPNVPTEPLDCATHGTRDFPPIADFPASLQQFTLDPKYALFLRRFGFVVIPNTYNERVVAELLAKQLKGIKKLSGIDFKDLENTLSSTAFSKIGGNNGGRVQIVYSADNLQTMPEAEKHYAQNCALMRVLKAVPQYQWNGKKVVATAVPFKWHKANFWWLKDRLILQLPQYAVDQVTRREKQAAATSKASLASAAGASETDAVDSDSQ